MHIFSFSEQATKQSRREELVAGEGGKARGSNTTSLWASSIKSWNRKIHGPLLQAVQVGTDLGKQLVAVDLGVGCSLNLNRDGDTNEPSGKDVSLTATRGLEKVIHLCAVPRFVTPPWTCFLFLLDGKKKLKS